MYYILGMLCVWLAGARVVLASVVPTEWYYDERYSKQNSFFAMNMGFSPLANLIKQDLEKQRQQKGWLERILERKPSIEFQLVDVTYRCRLRELNGIPKVFLYNHGSMLEGLDDASSISLTSEEPRKTALFLQYWEDDSRTLVCNFLYTDAPNFINLPLIHNYDLERVLKNAPVGSVVETFGTKFKILERDESRYKKASFFRRHRPKQTS